MSNEEGNFEFIRFIQIDRQFELVVIVFSLSLLTIDVAHILLAREWTRWTEVERQW